MSGRNWLASPGLVYVGAWVAGLLIESNTPGSSASTADLRAYFLTHRQAHLIQSYVIDGIAGVAVLVFAAVLKGVFRKVDSETATLSDVVLGAGVAAASVSLAQAGIQQVLANPDVLAAGDAPIRTILALVNATDTFKLLALALLSGTASILTFRTRVLPRSFGGLGIVLSLMLIVGGLSFVGNNPAFSVVLLLSLPLLLLWVGGISVVLLRRCESGT